MRSYSLPALQCGRLPRPREAANRRGRESQGRPCLERPPPRLRHVVVAADLRAIELVAEPTAMRHEADAAVAGGVSALHDTLLACWVPTGRDISSCSVKQPASQYRRRVCGSRT